MAIIKRKDSLGRNYFINENTGKRTTEASYKRSNPSAKNQFRSGGKPSYATCSTAGRTLKKKGTSAAGKTLARCK
jgi:hypothetical protein